ncbi:MAG TPA: cyclodeaminase/cyclohydrolase family protein [Phycisphaerae bacterium]|nr:cyclodeaminase/cyclohydrolase family protein [Phycisphaerae bacterium]
MEKENLLEMSVADFIAATAAKTPTPGGGSVAGVVGALGTALGQMALNFTRGKKKYAEHEEFYERLGKRLEIAAKMFQDLVADDVAAYRLYQEAAKQEDSPQKQAAVQLATAAAIDVPREVTKLSLAVLADLKALQPRSNPYLITDLLAAGLLAVAAAKLSDYNVRINVPNVDDNRAAADIKKASADDLAKAQAILEELEQAAKEFLP